jgi:hypothetical protein
MVNVYGLYTGAFNAPKRRREVLQYWQTLSPPSPERDTLQQAFRRGFRGNYRALLIWLYTESLKLCDALYPYVTRKLTGEGKGTEVHGRAPFTFSPRTYVLIDPLCPEPVERALAAMQKDPEMAVTTEKTLGLYWYHRNP